MLIPGCILLGVILGYQLIVEPMRITRADECRPMFLSQSLGHTNPPILPFPPYGMTALVDCNLEVYEHARCGSSHQLSYAGWTWDCRDDAPHSTSLFLREHLPISAPQDNMFLQQPHAATAAAEDQGQEEIEVDYSHMDRDRDESVTGNMFQWLRGTDGFPLAGRDIREHKWIDNLYDSDDDNEVPRRKGMGGRLLLGGSMRVP